MDHMLLERRLSLKLDSSTLMVNPIAILLMIGFNFTSVKPITTFFLRP